MHDCGAPLVSDGRHQSLSVIKHTHTLNDTQRSLDSHSGWTADAILYIVRSLHHQVFLDNLHALHWLACSPELLHFVCLETVCSEQLFHRTSYGRAGVTRAQLTTLAFKSRRACFMSSLFWMFVLCGVCSAKEMWFLCTVSHECNTPHVNTDIDMVVCILIAFFLTCTLYWSLSSIESGKESLWWRGMNLAD